MSNLKKLRKQREIKGSRYSDMLIYDAYIFSL